MKKYLIILTLITICSVIYSFLLYQKFGVFDKNLILLENQISRQNNDVVNGYKILYENFYLEELLTCQLFDSLLISTKDDDFCLVVRFNDKCCSSCVEKLILDIKELDISKNIKIIASYEYKSEVELLKKIKLRGYDFIEFPKEISNQLIENYNIPYVIALKNGCFHSIFFPSDNKFISLKNYVEILKN